MPKSVYYGSGSAELFQCVSQQAIAGSYKGAGRRFKRRRNERQKLKARTQVKPQTRGFG